MQEYENPNGSNILLFSGIIYGEPCSKANSRKVAQNRATGRMLFIKSKGALEYCESFILQIHKRNAIIQEKSGAWPEEITCKVALHCNIYYGSERKDLDESLIMDCLEKSRVIKNDRLIREKHIYHHIDKKSPRSIIRLYERV